MRLVGDLDSSFELIKLWIWLYKYNLYIFINIRNLKSTIKHTINRMQSVLFSRNKHKHKNNNVLLLMHFSGFTNLLYFPLLIAVISHLVLVALCVDFIKVTAKYVKFDVSLWWQKSFILQQLLEDIAMFSPWWISDDPLLVYQPNEIILANPCYIVLDRPLVYHYI